MLITPTWHLVFFLLKSNDARLAPGMPPSEIRVEPVRRCIDAFQRARLSRLTRSTSRRCISYLTIDPPHSKSAIPPGIAAVDRDRVSDVTDCLDACPWNRFRQSFPETSFEARETRRKWRYAIIGPNRQTIPGNVPSISDQRYARGCHAQRFCGLWETSCTSDFACVGAGRDDPEPLIAESAVGRLIKSGRERLGRIVGTKKKRVVVEADTKIGPGLLSESKHPPWCNLY